MFADLCPLLSSVVISSAGRFGLFGVFSSFLRSSPQTDCSSQTPYASKSCCGSTGLILWSCYGSGSGSGHGSNVALLWFCSPVFLLTNCWSIPLALIYLQVWREAEQMTIAESDEVTWWDDLKVKGHQEPPACTENRLWVYLYCLSLRGGKLNVGKCLKLLQEPYLYY